MIFIVVILGGAITGGLTHRVLTSIHHGKQTRQKIDSQNIALARDMLADYMLVRSARPLMSLVPVYGQSTILLFSSMHLTGTWTFLTAWA